MKLVDSVSLGASFLWSSVVVWLVGVGPSELLSVLAYSFWGDAGLIAPAGLLGPAGCPRVSLFVPVILP